MPKTSHGNTNVGNNDIPTFRSPYRQWLLNEFCRRQKLNPAYSLRALARDLQVSRTCLSELFQGKRNLSIQSARKIADQLGLRPKERQRFLREVKENPFIKAPSQTAAHLQLEEDEFSLISDWHYFAILSLARLPKQSANPKKIATRLGIPTAQVRLAVERLLRLELIQITKQNYLKRTSNPIQTTTDIPSGAIRCYHQSNLARAMEALHTAQIDIREFIAISMPTDLRRLEATKKRIRTFARRVSKELAAGHPTEVFTLAIQLFPQTEIATGAKKNKGTTK